MAPTQPDRVGLEVDSVTMTFGDFRALNEVSARFEPGQVHAVVGQNGAGKTTFSRVVTGLYTPTAGSVALDGVALPLGDVHATRARGVDMVHQSFALPPSASVAEALELFAPAQPPVFWRAGLVRHWQGVLDEQGAAIDASARVRDLSVQARQTLEIVRALAGHPRLIILDEPTAVLPPQDVDRLFARVRALAGQGLVVVVVLHKLAEVFAVADTVTVLRAGRVVVPTTPIAQLSEQAISQGIVGENTDVFDVGPPPKAPSIGGAAPTDPTGTKNRATPGGTTEVTEPTVLEFAGVDVPKSGTEPAFDAVDMRVRAGEIVGIAGVEGNGQETLARLVLGLTLPTGGTAHLHGRDVTRMGVLGRRRLGLRAVPFDRNSQGISASSPVWLNATISEVLIGTRRFFSLSALKKRGAQIADRFSTSFRSVEQNAGELSGGNVQRLILGRELDDGARLVLAAQPTRGLDIAATALVHRALSGVAGQGGAVVLISTDLDELKELSTRILVLRGGKFVADLPPSAPLSDLGAAMIGAAR